MPASWDRLKGRAARFHCSPAAVSTQDKITAACCLPVEPKNRRRPSNSLLEEIHAEPCWPVQHVPTRLHYHAGETPMECSVLKKTNCWMNSAKNTTTGPKDLLLGSQNIIRCPGELLVRIPIIQKHVDTTYCMTIWQWRSVSVCGKVHLWNYGFKYLWSSSSIHLDLVIILDTFMKSFYSKKWIVF